MSEPEACITEPAPSAWDPEPLPTTQPYKVPVVRADCSDLPRPCPHLTCRYHLGETGVAAGASCALDVADEGPHSTLRVGELLGISKEWTAQIEAKVLAKLSRKPIMRELAGMRGGGRNMVSVERQAQVRRQLGGSKE